MRIHVPQPKPTTVSVDDWLMELLGAALVLDCPSLHADAKKQAARAKHFVRNAAERIEPTSCDSLSRAIQHAILKRIADPQVIAILSVRDSAEAKAKADAAYLQECAEKGWLTPEQVAERKRQKRRIAEARNTRALASRASEKSG